MRKTVIWKISEIFFLSLFCFSIIFPNSSTGHAANIAAITATSSSGDATDNSNQRKTFYDTVNKRHWAFYYDGSAIQYKRSIDGTNWTSANSLPYNTSDFSVFYKIINSIGYVYVATECNTYDICLLKGTLTSTAINFESASTAFDGSSLTNKYRQPNVALDSTNKIWVAAVKDFGSVWSQHLQAAIVESSNPNDPSSFEAMTLIGRRSTVLKDLVLIPQENDEMFLIANSDQSNIVSYKYNGTVWTDANKNGGYSWFNVPDGIDGSVSTMALDGTNIYVGGYFTTTNDDPKTSKIAKYSASTGTWEALGNGISGSDVKSIRVFNGKVYVGGMFDSASGVDNTSGLAAFNLNTKSWESVGNAILAGTPIVCSIDAAGNNIYVGGYFTDINGVAGTASIARFSLDDSLWHAMNNGISGDNPPFGNSVNTIKASGANIYVGGDFANIDGIANTADFALWDGASWQAKYTTPFTNSPFGTTIINDIEISDDKVYIGGSFANANGDANADNLAILTISSGTWQAVGTAPLNSEVRDIYLDQNGFYAAGAFTDVDGNSSIDYLAYFDTTWHQVVDSIGNTVNSVVKIGGQVYFGGGFLDISGNGNLRYLATSAEETTQGLGSGFDGSIYSMTVVGTDVYVGGNFTSVGGVPNTKGIARLDTTNWSWHALGTGFGSDDFKVRELLPYKDGIVIGGQSSDYNDGPFLGSGILYYDGVTIQALDVQPGDGFATAGQNIFAMQVVGNDLYIGGNFNNFGGNANMKYIAKYNGSTWGPASNVSFNSQVYCLEYYNGYLYVGGYFYQLAGSEASFARIATATGIYQGLGDEFGGEAPYVIKEIGGQIYIGAWVANIAGNANADHIVRFDPTDLSWKNLGAGLGENFATPTVIAEYDGKILAGGNFTNSAGDTSVSQLAVFDGTSWTGLGSFVQGSDVDGAGTTVHTIANLGDFLFIGGDFVESTTFSQFMVGYGQATTINSDTKSQISSLTDSNGNIHLAFTDNAERVVYKRYDQAEAAWQPEVVLSETAKDPSISIDPSNNQLYISWIENNTIVYRTAIAPYALGDWQIPATIYENGINSNLVSDTSLGGGIIKFTWTNGEAAPYSVYTTYLGTADAPVQDEVVDEEEDGGTTPDEKTNPEVTSVTPSTDTTTTPTNPIIEIRPPENNVSTEETPLQPSEKIQEDTKIITPAGTSSEDTIKKENTSTSPSANPALPIAAAGIVIISILTMSSLTAASNNFSSWKDFSRSAWRSFFLLGIRQKEKDRFGKVIDINTNLPIPFAKLDLYRLESQDDHIGKLVGTTYSDKEGCYAFVDEPGLYRLNIVKDNYEIASKEGFYQKDGTINLGQESDKFVREQVAMYQPNGGLDNQTSFVQSVSRTASVFSDISLLALIAGTLLYGIECYKNPGTFNYYVAAVYLVIWIYSIATRARKRNTLGRVLERNSENPISLALIRVFNADTNKLEKTIASDNNGKIAAALKQNRYLIYGMKSGYKQTHPEEFNASDRFSVLNLEIKLEKN